MEIKNFQWGTKTWSQYWIKPSKKRVLGSCALASSSIILPDGSSGLCLARANLHPMGLWVGIKDSAWSIKEFLRIKWRRFLYKL